MLLIGRFFSRSSYSFGSENEPKLIIPACQAYSICHFPVEQILTVMHTLAAVIFPLKIAATSLALSMLCCIKLRKKLDMHHCTTTKMDYSVNFAIHEHRFHGNTRSHHAQQRATHLMVVQRSSQMRMPYISCGQTIVGANQ